MSQSYSSDRRRILKLGLGAAAAVAALKMTTHASDALAADAPVLSESDPQAVALGYHTDSSKVDASKFKTHTADQSCSTCQLYAGAAGSASGPCPIFGGKMVNAHGWCTAWIKKA